MTIHPAIRRARAFDARRRALVRSSDSLAREARRCQRCIGASVGHPNQTSAARGHHRRRRAVLRGCGRRLTGRADDGGARRRRRGGPDAGERPRRRPGPGSSAGTRPRARAPRPACCARRATPSSSIVSRALVARDSAHASAFKRALGRVGKTAADRVDARALGVKASALSKAQRIVWRDGPVVGELVAVGAAKGDGARRPPRGHRAHARAAHRRPERLGRRCSPAPPARAPAPRRPQQAFALAVAPLPGVRVPRGPRGSIPDGTLATSWVLANYGRLTPSRRPAVDKIVRKAFALSW